MVPEAQPQPSGPAQPRSWGLAPKLRLSSPRTKEPAPYEGELHAASSPREPGPFRPQAPRPRVRRPSRAVGDVTEGRAAGLAKAQCDVPEGTSRQPCGQRQGWGTGEPGWEACRTLPGAAFWLSRACGARLPPSGNTSPGFPQVISLTPLVGAEIKRTNTQGPTPTLAAPLPLRMCNHRGKRLW